MTSQDDLVKSVFRLLNYYRERIWWITSRIVVLTVAITVVRMVVAPKYVARTKFSILPSRGEMSLASARPMDILSLGGPASAAVQSHTETILSRTLSEDVARTLQNGAPATTTGFSLPGFIFRWIVSPVVGTVQRLLTFVNTGRWPPAPDAVKTFAETILSRTRIDNVPAGSSVFQLGVTWQDPNTAARIANLMTERYVQRVMRVNREELQTTREKISTLVAESSKELELLDSKIRDYRITQKQFSPSSGTELGLQELSQYVRDLTSTRIAREQIDARINALKPFQTPAMMAAVKAERDSLKARETSTEKVIEEQFGKLETMPAKETGLLDLYRDRVVKERSLAAMRERLLESNAVEASQNSPVRIIDEAVPPDYPERPLLLRSTGSSIMVGLLLSAGFVLLVESRRAGLRCRMDLGAKGDAMIGLVPYVAKPGQDGHDAEKSGRLAEFFRSVAHGRYGTVSHRRTVKLHLEHLLVNLSEGGGRVIMLSSLNGKEGKTFLICQFAKLAKEAGRKLLLVDANLMKPALHIAFGRQPSAGLAEMLTGDTQARDAVIAVDESTDLICAGLKRPNMQAKWALDDVSRQLAGISSKYDLVLIDSAALRSDPSAARLLPLATAFLCIFDATTSLRTDLPDLANRFKGVSDRLMFVLNKVLHSADHLFADTDDGRTMTRPGTSGTATDSLEKAGPDDEVEV